MTVAEKVGQMSQIDLGVVAVGDICALKQPQTVDVQKLKLAIEKYKIGSILNVGCASGTIALADWRKMIALIGDETQKYSRLKIPILYGIDAIHGATYTKGSTLFPQEIGQAATWNPAMVEKANAISAYETRASSLPWNFSPVLDLGRNPLWSRFFETYGEDVYLAKAMAKAAITGLQGENVNNPYKVAACMKHFLGYSAPLSGKDRTPAWISDRELREYFLPTFQQAIEAGAKTVMINSGEINGTPVHANYDILTTLLRNELGFKGVAVTDWEDIYKLVDKHRVAANKKEAVKMAIMAGIDMSMTPNNFEFNDLLIELVQEGAVPESRLDESVRRILTLKQELGLFEQLYFDKNLYTKFGSKEHSDVNYAVASESITLLKNKNNTLPLQKNNEKILICGAAANSINLLNGAWTHTWQGVDTAYNNAGKRTILAALQQNFGKNNVLYAKGSSLDSLMDLEYCIKQAKKADKIIICLGEQPCTEGVGNIDDLTLPQAQRTLVMELSKLNKPIILICSFNRPRIIHDIVGKADAILYAYLSGDEGGRAIADCISGTVNPSGKLPFTYPKATNDLVHYDHKTTEEADVDFSMNAYRPEFDFGFGLSYSTFAYSPMKLSKTTLADGETLELSVTVTNKSTRKGSEVVQLYYKDLVASITPAAKKLTGFDKITLNAGESKELVFKLTKESFSFIAKNLKRITEVGEIELQIGAEKKMINIK
ncbi:MAG: Periplasmic beta-glucosidase precursor [Bacteroidota bacterium]